MSLKNFPLDLVVQTPGHLPACVWGGAGQGKTSYITNLFRFLDGPLEVVIGAIREPADFGGIPKPETDGMTMVAPAWAKRINREVKGKSIGGVFFSELTCSPPAVQAAMLRVLHEGWVGEEKLADSVVRIADANPPDVAAGGWELALPVANRLTHLVWPSVETDEWCDGFMNGWQSQSFTRVDLEKWKDEYPTCKALIAAFLKSPVGLNMLSEDMTKDPSRFPQAFFTPRTVENAARLLATVQATGRTDTLLTLMTASCGPVWGGKFASWLQSANLPDPEVVLHDPASWTPEKARPDVIYAVLMSVTACALKMGPKDRDQRWIRAWLVLEHVLSHGFGRGFVAVAAQMLTAKNARPNVAKVPKEASKVISELHPLLRASGLYDSLR